MSFLLCIDTSLEAAFVSITKDGKTIAVRENAIQNNHAAFIHPAIRDMVNECSVSLNDVDAIAVTTGPGSYTGIRIGIAAAKGLAFSLNKPVIGVSTLFLMAWAARSGREQERFLFCPLIDARRMEVYAAVYDEQMTELLAPTNLLIDENAFVEFLEHHEMIFTGSGTDKFCKIFNHPRAHFETLPSLVETMGMIAEMEVQNKKIITAYSILPQYVKAFYEG